ncbi:DUF2628 domain-containing protein [Maridesulfovibrio hydrothermalis]|uniref:DUF2628 domain-containing protein n=1 Tax=Maridesulfovibrio hydrothermalis AM13 = DSM 14728 TaxID=1121451 RepID=L0R7Z6_9BACT|nr:DUF2628 domain-containing protein [Maridesulfovibrio hydrothermalis]CCO22863.1 conserved membrane protein of unknown function [Maridesulfovibrio hydrothermalis AM13 = DSM 14728]
MQFVTSDDYVDFTGPNAGKYLFNFAKFQTLRDGFTVTWHWPAFLFGFWWFLYRKMYFWAFVTFLVGFLPFGNFIAQIGYGLSAYYFYYRDSTSKIGAIKATVPEGRARDVIRETGGVHWWVKIAGAVCFFLQPLWIFVMSLLFGSAFIFSFQQVML